MNGNDKKKYFVFLLIYVLLCNSKFWTVKSIEPKREAKKIFAR
jgi:hypothetical protein